MPKIVDFDKRTMSITYQSNRDCKYREIVCVVVDKPVEKILAFWDRKYVGFTRIDPTADPQFHPTNPVE